MLSRRRRELNYFLGVRDPMSTSIVHDADSIPPPSTKLPSNKLLVSLLGATLLIGGVITYLRNR